MRNLDEIIKTYKREAFIVGRRLGQSEALIKGFTIKH